MVRRLLRLGHCPAGKRPDLQCTWRGMERGQLLGGMGFWNSASCRRAEIPSAGGLASGRGLARVANMLALGGSVGGRRVLGPRGFAALHAEATEECIFGMKTFFTQVRGVC